MIQRGRPASPDVRGVAAPASSEIDSTAERHATGKVHPRALAPDGARRQEHVARPVELDPIRAIAMVDEERPRVQSRVRGLPHPEHLPEEGRDRPARTPIAGCILGRRDQPPEQLLDGQAVHEHLVTVDHVVTEIAGPARKTRLDERFELGRGEDAEPHRGQCRTAFLGACGDRPCAFTGPDVENGIREPGSENEGPFPCLHARGTLEDFQERAVRQVDVRVDRVVRIRHLQCESTLMAGAEPRHDLFHDLQVRLDVQGRKLAETLGDAVDALPAHVERDHARIGNDRAHDLPNGILTHRRTGVLAAQASEKVDQPVARDAAFRCSATRSDGCPIAGSGRDSPGCPARPSRERTAS